MNQIILRAPAHIDHGETTLINALTGIDTDRLKEGKGNLTGKIFTIKDASLPRASGGISRSSLASIPTNSRQN